MKKILFFAVFSIFGNAAFSQNCPVITSADIITVGPNSYQLAVTYTADGQKHIVDSIFNNGVFVSTECHDVKGSGSFTKSFTLSGLPSAIIEPGTGTCINGTTCGTSIFICPSCGPMPVTLSSFTAQRFKNNVLLSWQTQTELNSSHFDILRSYDNRNFEKIGSVNNLSANSNIVHNYSFTDYSNTSMSVIYYKLKIIDLDGKFVYSETRVIKNNSDNSDLIVFPNPAVSNSSITISGISEPTQVKFLDNSGRVLKVVNLNLSNSIELSGFQRGTYIMMITGRKSGQTVVRKLTVIN